MSGHRLGSGGRVNRRRLLKISAASTACILAGTAWGRTAERIHRWTGIALGARAEINLLHEDDATAQSLFRSVEAEILRLEKIFSLYKPDSELVRLNEAGRLTAPSHEFLDLLGTVRRVHDLSNGAFDPTVQTLWACYADQRTSNGELGTALRKTGFPKVVVSSREIRFLEDGMAMTLNGIAQGYVTDRVTQLLKTNGLIDVVVDLGEISAMGSNTAGETLTGEGWPVTLRPDPSMKNAQVRTHLKDMAVASSACTSMTFDGRKLLSHIIDPKTGRTVDADLRAVSVLAGSAALADGLSTAALVTGKAGLSRALRNVPDAKAFVVGRDGVSDWLSE